MEEKKSRKNPVRTVWNIFTTVLVAAVVIVAFLIVGVRIFGIKTFVVLSPSMEPTFSTGALVYVKKIDASKVEVGDVITFYLDDETPATHRVYEIVKDSNGDPCFRTKGDANKVVDSKLVMAEQLIGKEILAIPRLGKLVEYIHTTNGRLVAIGIGVALVALIAIPDLLFPKNGKKDKKDEPPAEEAAAEAPKEDPNI